MRRVGSVSFVAVMLLGVSAWSASRTAERGTQIAVRTGEPIDFSSLGKGRVYGGKVDQDVVDSLGNVLVPKGAEAQLTVRNASGGGTMEVLIPAETVLTFRLNEKIEL
jgi:hypothetical protein